MKFFLSEHEWRLSRQALPIVVAVRWRLWRTPFPVLQAQWRAQVQTTLDAAVSNATASDAAASDATASDATASDAAASDAAASDATASDAGAEVPDRASIVEAWRCAQAVSRAARLVPVASCLTQAMALQLLLARRGQHCAVCIGVERRTAPSTDAAAPGAQPGATDAVGKPHPAAHGSDLADGRFRAHAWVEWHGRVLIGGDVRRWKPLTIFAPVVAVAPPAASTPSN